MSDQQELRRRVRAAMALTDVTSWEQLAAKTGFSRSLLKDAGTARGVLEERHLRVIAAKLEIPYAWFTVADVFEAISREEDEPSTPERLEALELQMRALTTRLTARPNPPAPPEGLLPPEDDEPS